MHKLAPYELPVRPYPFFLRWLLRWLQRRCHHYSLKADVLEGGGGVYAVRWCETCGAIQLTCDGTPRPFRNCEPTWERTWSWHRRLYQWER